MLLDLHPPRETLRACPHSPAARCNISDMYITSDTSVNASSGGPARGRLPSRQGHPRAATPARRRPPYDTPVRSG